MAHVTGVVLGAGEATRMGRSKQQLPFGNTTLLGWAVRQAEASLLDEVVVVVGPGDKHPTEGRSRLVVNETPHAGSVTSLQAGVKAAGAVAVMALLGDMPGVKTPTINAMLKAWQVEPRWAAVARCTDELGHPLILSPFLAAALDGKRGDKVLWPMLEPDPENEAEILYVDINHPRPMDVNTQDDYVFACQQAGFAPG